MTDGVVHFPLKPKRKKLSTSDIETIGFLTVDDRDLYIQDPGDIAKIMAFIIREKIPILEGE